MAEEKIVTLWGEPKRINGYIDKYLEKSRPKIGWEKEADINHFKLFELIAMYEYGIKKETIKELFSFNKINWAIKTLEKEFAGLMSRARIDLIKHCLEIRHRKILNILEVK